MKATELRIGNYVKLQGVDKPIRVSIIDTTETVNTKSNPIPLTEEWLLKFGFKKYISGSWCLDLNHRYEYLAIDLKNNNPLRLVINNVGEENSLELPHINYVHQLQNVYFMHTNKELNLI